MKSGQITLTSTLSLALLLGAPSLATAQDESQQDAATGDYMATQTQPATPGMWDQERVEQRLEDLGYSDITDLREQDGRWVFTGRTEQAFDPSTGEVGPAGGYRATQTQPASPQMWDPQAIEQELTEQGYGDVSEISREGSGGWQVTARKDGEEQTLTIDPQTGEIRDEADEIVASMSQSISGYMATQMHPAAPAAWDLAAVEETMQELGYSDIGELTQQGAERRFTARRGDETVNLSLEPRTGEIRSETGEILATLPERVGGYRATQIQPATPRMWDQEAVEADLQEMGYSDIGELRQENGQWTVEARRDGETSVLNINPQTGEIFTRERVGSLSETAAGERQNDNQQ